MTSYLFREIAVQHGLPMQDFVVRNDSGCGSTIGPIMASGVPFARLPQAEAVSVTQRALSVT